MIVKNEMNYRSDPTLTILRTLWSSTKRKIKMNNTSVLNAESFFGVVAV